MTLIIFCHPDKEKKSHSHKTLKTVETSLKREKIRFDTIDLYKEKFQPNLSGEEYMRMKERNEASEHDVKRIQKKIAEASTLIFIYPVWWYAMPARLKGFMDRVFTAGFAYSFFRTNKVQMLMAWMLSWIPGIRKLLQSHSAKGLLKEKKVIVFRSYGGPALGKRVFGNTQKSLENAILHLCGIRDITVHELFNCDKKIFTHAYETNFLKKAGKIVIEKCK